MHKATDQFFRNIKPGDSVTVAWPDARLDPWEGYGRRGKVIQVTPDFAVVRSPAGFCFCVGKHHVATGAKIGLNGGASQCNGSQSGSLPAAKTR